MKKYRLYDMPDYMVVVMNKNNCIGEYDTIEEATRGAVSYDMDCDGECCIYICQYNPEVKKYLAIDAELFNYDAELAMAREVEA